MNPTLARLKDRYGDSIRVVFRDFPILQIHPQAAKAAEAGACANDQGKFWPMHDLMFANQAEARRGQPQAARGRRWASTPPPSRSASTRANTPTEWKKDAADAEKAGVQSTPAFFINGRPVTGAVPYEQFAAVIDEELGRREPSRSRRRRPLRRGGVAGGSARAVTSPQVGRATGR